MIQYNNHNNIKEIHYNNHSIKYVYGCGGNLVWSGDTPTPPTPTPYESQYLTFVVTSDNSRFGWHKQSDNIVYYSVDGGNVWQELSEEVTVFNAGTNILCKCTNPTATSREGIGNFIAMGSFNVQGNIMSMKYGDNFIGQTAMNDYQFASLFIMCDVYDVTNLVLPATATTQLCYSLLFSGTKITTVPTINTVDTSTSCYQGMFQDCSNLVNVPSDYLPATTLSTGCYANMFKNCSSLVTAPDLLATSVAGSCYSNMFYGCTNLNYIKCLLTNAWYSIDTYNWVYGTAASGTFVKTAGINWQNGANGIPNGWTVQDA